MRIGLKTIVAILALVVGGTSAARAAGDNFMINGSLQQSTAHTTCATALGDAYDALCPSDPSGKMTCGCDTFNANVKGNLTGKVTDLSGTLHVTSDGGAAVDTPDCEPVAGELSFTGSKDTEVVYLNGARCGPQSNGTRALLGGWGIFSSSKSLKGAGTFKGTIKADNSYSLNFTGATAK